MPSTRSKPVIWSMSWCTSASWRSRSANSIASCTVLEIARPSRASSSRVRSRLSRSSSHANSTIRTVIGTASATNSFVPIRMTRPGRCRPESFRAEMSEGSPHREV